MKFLHPAKTGGTSVEYTGLENGYLWGLHDDEYLRSLRRTERSMGWSVWHTPTEDFLDELYPGEEIFSIKRNPYDRAVSSFYCPYNHSSTSSSLDEFNAWISLTCKFRHRHYMIPCAAYVADIYLEFSNLNEEFKDLFGFEIDHEIHKSVKKYGVEDLYPETIDVINIAMHSDFEKFGYERIEV